MFKKHKRKLFSLVLSLILLLQMFTPPVFAQNNNTVNISNQQNGYKANILISSLTDDTDAVELEFYDTKSTDDNGHVYFDLEPLLEEQEGQYKSTTLNKTLLRGIGQGVNLGDRYLQEFRAEYIRLIKYFGWDKSQKTDLDHVSTQIAIYNFLWPLGNDEEADKLFEQKLEVTNAQGESVKAQVVDKITAIFNEIDKYSKNKTNPNNLKTAVEVAEGKEEKYKGFSGYRVMDQDQLPEGLKAFVEGDNLVLRYTKPLDVKEAIDKNYTLQLREKAANSNPSLAYYSTSEADNRDRQTNKLAMLHYSPESVNVNVHYTAEAGLDYDEKDVTTVKETSNKSYAGSFPVKGDKPIVTPIDFDFFKLKDAQGRDLFCIEPAKKPVYGRFVESDLNGLELTGTKDMGTKYISLQDIEKAERIVYLGWEQSAKTDYDYLITQLALWNHLWKVDFNTLETISLEHFTIKDDNGKELRPQIIKDLKTLSQEVNAFDESQLNLDFDKQDFSLENKKEITVTDRNNNLDNFEITNKESLPEYITLQKTANQIKITLDLDAADTEQKGDFTLQFRNKDYKPQEKSRALLPLEDTASQKMGYFVLNKDLSNSLKFNWHVAVLPKIDIHVEKVWDDNNDQDGIRPESITVRLLADGVDTGLSKVLSAENNWSADFTGLNETKDGQKINYKLEEDTPKGYKDSQTEKAINSYIITNKHTPETTSIKVNKTFDDNFNQDGLRPSEVTVYLYKNGVKTNKSLVLNESNQWQGEFSGLDKYEDGAEITYTVQEEIDEDSAYTAKVKKTATGFEVINKHEPIKTKVKVRKDWLDNEDQDGKRPDEIVVKLLANGEEIGQETVLNATNNWAHEFTDLDKYKAGHEIDYTVKELKVANYDSHIVTAAKNDFVIKNSHTTAQVDVKVRKDWNDNNDQDGLRPSEVTVKLLANGEDTGLSKTLNAENNWSAIFKDLDKYKDGQVITYSLEEVKVNAYESIVKPNSEYDFTITNTHEPIKTKVKVNKVWDDKDNQDGKRPESITVKLFADNVDTGISLNLNKANGFAGEFANLDKYKNGEEIIYSVDEIVPTGYTKNIIENTTNDFTIKNSYTPEKLSVSVRKTFNDFDDQDGKRPDNVTVVLLKDGERTDEEAILDKSNNWAYEFTGLDKYEDGRAIEYTVEEKDVPEGYTVSINGSVATGFTVQNTYTPEFVSVEGTKTWDDNDDQDGMRPSSIIVKLMRNGEEVRRQRVTAEDNWQYSFTGLNKYTDGELNKYTIEEVAVNKYETIYAENGLDITNKHEIEKTKVNVEKVWDDKDNQDGIRPSEVTVKLLADGKETGKETVLNKENNWSYEFTGLDKYSEGHEIKYTVQEKELEDYTVINEKLSKNNYRLTNIYKPGKTSISVDKVWDDNDNQDGKRSESIKVMLLKDKEETNKIITLSEENNWHGEFVNLDEYKDGKLIDYSVKEIGVPEEYDSKISKDDKHFTIKNSYTPGKTSVEVSKEWLDQDNQDGKRPSEVTVKLLADNQDTGKRLVLNKENNWSGVFDDLDEYKEGQLIKYSVEEMQVKEYKSDITEVSDKVFKITNSYTPGKTSINVRKVFDDNNDQDGIRAEVIKVKLLANGEDTGKELTLDVSNDFKGQFDDLDEYKDGQLIDYSIAEIKVDHYESIITQEDDNSFVITNRHAPFKTFVNVRKVWDDNDNQDGKRPESVKVVLMANGERTDKEVILDESNDWSYEFTNLDKFKEGKEIEYKVIEVEVPEGYTDIVESDAKNSFVITNSYTPGKTAVKVEKQWLDDENRDGIRPESITVVLLANGEETDRQYVLSEDNDWSATFKDLDEYKDGELIDYTVQEIGEVKDYETAIKEVEDNMFVITNKHEPVETKVKVSKVFEDEDNRDKIRPESVEVILVANGKDTDKKLILNKDNDFKGEFTGLKKFEDGEEIKYSVRETKVEGYEASIEETAANVFVITNKHEPKKQESIKTLAKIDGKDEKVVKDDEDIVLSDTVSYKNFKVGQEYTIKGVLMQKNGKPVITVDKDGNKVKVTAETTFVAEEENGTVELQFKFNTKDIRGSLVVFEEAYEVESKTLVDKDGKEVEKKELKKVCEHKDLKDKDQTVKIVDEKVQTNAISAKPISIGLAVIAAAAVVLLILRRRRFNEDEE